MNFYIINSLAVLTSLLATAIFYLGCPNQQWLPRSPFGFYPALIGSLVLAVLSCGLFLFHFDTLPAIFTLITLFMLALGVAPFLSRHNKPVSLGEKVKKAINKKHSGPPYQTHWWLKSVSGVVLGIPLAICLAGLISWWGPGDVTHNGKSQLVMWLITPLWLLPLSLIFFVNNGKRVFIGYIGSSLIIYSLLWLAKTGV